MSMKITTGELRRAIDVLLAEFEANGVSEWDVDRDYYWDVPSDVRYDPYAHPTQLSLGQLSYDIERVKKLADGSNGPVSLGLVWVASILRIAGETGWMAMKRIPISDGETDEEEDV
jgi:hypothetical protein